jgi:hypothetical protein
MTFHNRVCSSLLLAMELSSLKPHGGSLGHSFAIELI